MSTAGLLESDGRSGRSFVSVRWLLLASVLVAELLLLSAEFHAPIPPPGSSWWVELVANSQNFVQVGVAFLGAFFVLLAPRLKETVEHARTCAAGYMWWPWLPLHLAAFAVLHF